MVFAQYSCVQKASERGNVPRYCPRKYWVFLQERERNGKGRDVEFCQALV